MKTFFDARMRVFEQETVWVTKEGKHCIAKELSNAHLENIVRMLEGAYQRVDKKDKPYSYAKAAKLYRDYLLYNTWRKIQDIK